MTMVPTYQIIKFQAGCCCYVQSVGLTPFGQNGGGQVGASECFHFLANPMYDGLHLMKVLQDFVCFGSFCDFGQDHTRNNALPMKPIEQTKQAQHNLLAIARLSWGKASPNA